MENKDHGIGRSGIGKFGFQESITNLAGMCSSINRESYRLLEQRLCISDKSLIDGTII